MFRLDWGSPKITLGEFHSYLGTLLGESFNGLIEEQSYLYIDTSSPLTGEQEAAILEYVYQLNSTPKKVKLDEPKDADGATMHRAKAAKAGWTYHMTAPEFTTSLLGSLYHKDISLNNLNEASVKFYDANNTELTTQESCDTDCVKTVFVFEPTWDYEIIGGTIKTANDVTDDVRVWVVAVPDVPAAYGGSKIMVQNVNLKYVDPNNGIEADGRASKYMAYSATYHTNKLQLIVRHPAGHKLAMMMAFEVYRA
jgi:hypothetical protein